MTEINEPTSNLKQEEITLKLLANSIIRTNDFREFVDVSITNKTKQYIHEEYRLDVENMVRKIIFSKSFLKELKKSLEVIE